MKIRNTKTRNRYSVNFLRNILKKQNFYLFKSGNLHQTEFTILRSNLSKQNIKFYRIKTHLAKAVFKESIYHNLIHLIEGPLLLAYSSESNEKLLDFNDVEKSLILLGYKTGLKFYSASELEHEKNFTQQAAQLKYCFALKKPLKKLISVLAFENDRKQQKLI
jgi:ribosomal protein L10